MKIELNIKQIQLNG